MANELRWREGAQAWLTRHRLPTDEATVGVVAERLRARRRWRGVSLAALCAIVAVLAWLLERYEVGDGTGFVSLVALVAAGVGGDVLRRRLVWHRWDRRPIAALPMSGPAAAGGALVFVVAAAVHAGALLEVARRRAMPAGDAAALAVDDRLRGEEASGGAPKGLRWILAVPLLAGVPDPTVMQLGLVVFLVGYLCTSGATRHRYAYEQVGGELVAR